jgi:GTP pyrophosphokinase
MTENILEKNPLPDNATAFSAANNNVEAGTAPPTALSMTEEQLEKEKKEILRRYRQILRKAGPLLRGDDTKKIKKAFEIAMEAHGGVRRKSGEPYIYHPLEVARIVVEEMGLGGTSIVCALLHDVVEDTEIELKDIEKDFGVKVARIIDGLTKVKIVALENKSEQLENYRRMLLTISEDIRVVLVKIADRLHNMRTLDSMPRHKQLKIKSETEYIYAPLAHRLGLYSIKSELEDLCLKFSDRVAYDGIRTKLKRSQQSRDRFIREFAKPIEVALSKRNFRFEIKSRLKSIYSIWMKMKKQDIPFEEVYDLFAIRIILDSQPENEKADCWSAYAIITDFYQPNPSRTRDWISLPKSNGYESLHTTVMSHTGQWVEVQIRSVRMDEIAEKGLAAHWKYKNKGGFSANAEQGIEEWLRKVRETLENKDTNALEFMDQFRRNLFNEEVYVFTPKGDLKKFPMGATVLDFAFDVHTEVGAHCLAAKVNQKLVPLNYTLKSGDQVEILTSTKAKVNEGWLKFVTTSKARAKIKEYMRDGKRAIAHEGKEIILRKLKQMKIQPSAEVFLKMIDYFGLKSEQELFYQVGNKDIDHTLIKKFNEAANLKTDSEHRKVAEQAPAKVALPVKNAQEIVIGGTNDKILYSLATCCNPIPGDDIFGMTTVSRGIKIHRTNCPNAVNIMASFGDRIIKARWATDDSQHEFDVNIRVIGTDRVGLLNDVTRLISTQLRVNIVGLSFSTGGGIFEGNMTLSLRDAEQLERLIAKIEAIDGVVRVTRYHL